MFAAKSELDGHLDVRCGCLFPPCQRLCCLVCSLRQLRIPLLFRKAFAICFDATSSLVAGSCSYGVAAYLLRRDNPRLRFAAVGLAGITAMQWVEGALWLDGMTTWSVTKIEE